MMDPANLLRAYHAAMSKVTFVQDTGGADVRFWKRAKVERPGKAADIIWLAHLDRCEGNGSPAACDAALSEALKMLMTTGGNKTT